MICMFFTVTPISYNVSARDSVGGSGSFPVRLSLFFALVAARRNLKRKCVIVTICLAGFWLCFCNLGSVINRHALFQIRKPTPMEQLAIPQELGLVPAELGLTNDDKSPPYGFYRQEGILDDFALVVYDPTGNIANISDCESWDEIHLSKPLDLFGRTYHYFQKMGAGLSVGSPRFFSRLFV